MSQVASSEALVAREKIKSFEDLAVWKKSHLLTLEIYRISSLFPKEEQYGITSQIRRASVSVPANIAEGFMRKSRLEKVRFYNIAQASLQEVKYYLILIKDLGLLSSGLKNSDLRNKLDEIGKMLNDLIHSIESADGRYPNP